MTSPIQWHVVEIDSGAFSLEVVVKATYWLSGRYCIDLRQEPERRRHLVGIGLAERAMSMDECAEAETRFRRDLIDFRTRELIDKETRTLRELLVAKAFAHGDDD